MSYLIIARPVYVGISKYNTDHNTVELRIKILYTSTHAQIIIAVYARGRDSPLI